MQFGLVNFLPSDVINVIFSFVGQRDCLICASVCRNWYNIIPQYTTTAWETVKFSADKPSDDNPNRYRFLGSHVKAITLIKYADAELYTMMEKLIRYGCRSVKNLVFINCSTVDQGPFIRLLKELAPSLTQLRIMVHRSDVALHHVLSVSPALKHFIFQASSFSYKYGDYDQEPLVHPSTGKSLDEFTSLTVLCLDVTMDKQLRLVPILKKCPNIRCFYDTSAGAYYGGSLDRNSLPPYESQVIDMENLFSWCPKITHLAVDSSYFSLYTVQADLENEPTIKVDQHHGVRRLRLCHMFNESQVISVLNENQHILELVSVTNEHFGTYYGFDCSPIFGPLHMSQLHTLEFIRVQIDGTTIVKLLNRCPLISTLVAFGKRSIVFDAPLIRDLQPTEALCSLECSSFKIENKADVLELLGRFPSLKRLSIKDSSVLVDIPETLSRLKQLTHLELCNVNMVRYTEHHFAPPTKLEMLDIQKVYNVGYDILSFVAQIPTLRLISVSLDDAVCENDKLGLHKFCELVSGESLENLQLFEVRCVPHILLDKLGDLPKLEAVSISAVYDDFNQELFTTRTSLSGVLRLLEKSTSLQQLHIEKTVFVEGQRVCQRDKVIDLFKQNIQKYTFDSVKSEEAQVLRDVRVRLKQ